MQWSFGKVLIVMFSLCVAIILISCAPEDPIAVSPNIPDQETTKEEIPKQVLPNNTSYSVIKSSNVKSVKRSVDVRLDEKVTKETLRLIAQQIKRQDLNKYDRTFIAFYLPNMDVGAGAWATTHYNPELQVKILGLSKVEEEKNKEPIDSSRNIVGVWFDERPYIGARIVIYEKTGKLFVETVYKDGSKSKEELVERKINSVRRFDSIKKSDFGEYWILDDAGKLKIFDNDGYILTYVTGSK